MAIPPDETVTQAIRGTIGPFRLEDVIGRGGMGVVYRGIDSGGNAAAVKVLSAHLATPELVRRFEREARIRIHHPNVVRVLEAGVDPDGTPWIAFELLEGENVRAWLASEGRTIADVVDLGVQTCRALVASHAAGVIHRDLKPSNLFRCTDGTIKLIDFGVALLPEETTRLTAFGAVVGTPTYLSPEQARGVGEVDERTDIWALGAVLYRALSGQAPFQRDTSLATIMAILLEEPLPLMVSAPEVPAGLAAIVERALCASKEARWATAEELGQVLGAFELGPETLAPIPRSSRPPPATSEQRVVALLLADGARDPATLDRAVRQRGGVPVRLLDGRTLGLFGGSTWEGDEVLRAVSAALSVRTAADRIGVASGRATLTGASVSGAAMEAAEETYRACAGGVAVDAEAARALAGAFTLRPLSGGAFEVCGDAPAMLSPPPPLETASPTLGRDAELAQMRVALRTVFDEQRALAVLVTGPPGIGKSRLRREMEAMLAYAGQAQSLFGQAEPHRRDAALSLFASVLETRARLGAMLRGWPSVRAEAPIEERRRAIAALCADAIGDPERARECATFLGELLGVPMPDDVALSAARADPQLLADRLRMSLFDFFAALCDRGPIALVLEDLQWADGASLEVADDLLDRLADAPLLLFATARPEIAEHEAHLFAGRDVIRLEPRGLPAAQVAPLAQAIAGRPLPEALVRAVAERSGGNPLFVEQIVLALADQDLVDADVEGLPLPLTVEAAVQSRLDHLPPAEKELCKRASVLRRPFAAVELRALGVGNVGPLLASLGRRDLVAARARSRSSRGRDHQFRSSLVADVAYRMVAPDQRGELHRRAAALAASADAGAEEVASHHELGGEAEKAARWYCDAVVEAARRGDQPSVLRCTARALALGPPAARLFALHMARCDALRFLGQPDEQASALAAALDHASTEAERARALTERVAWMTRTGGRLPEVLDVAQAAVAAARGAGDPDVLALAHGRRAVALILAGRLDAAREALDGARAAAQDASPHVRALVADWRAQLASSRGDLGEVLDLFRSAAASYAEAGDVRRAAGTEANLADAYNRFGAYAEAEAALRAALEGCRRVGNRLMEGYALANLGYSLTHLGRREQALSVLAEAERLAASTGTARLSVAIAGYRSRALLEGARPFDAAVPAEEAAARAEQAGLPALAVAALAVAARARLAADQREEAVALSGRALALRDDLGGIDEDDAEVFLARVLALRAAGREEEARAVQERGRRRLEELAGRIADPEWRARLVEGVAAHRALVAPVGDE